MGFLNHLRPRLMLRLFAAMVVLAFVLRLIGPYLVSSDSVEREIEAKLSAWTGAQLSFVGSPSFTFWPTPQMGFDNVRLRNHDLSAARGAELLTAERISVGFSLVGAFFGAPDLGEIELVRPTFHVHRDQLGSLNWRRSGQTAEVTPQQGGGQNRQQGQQSTALPALGEIAIRNGVIEVDDLRRGERYSITGVEGKIAWPRASSDITASLEGVVNGEPARVQFSADEPTKLLNGQTTTVQATLRSEPLALDFDGTVNLSKNAFASGRIKLATPSFGHLLAWRGARFAPAASLGSVDLEATITTNEHTARLDTVVLDIEDSSATGVLDLSLPPRAMPKIGGTLAFDRIDLAAMIAAYSALPGEDVPSPALPVAAIGGLFDLDLRLSAREALLEPLVVKEFAAGVRTIGGGTSLDIGDGSVLGGQVSGEIKVHDQHLRPGGELQLALRDVDLGTLIGLSGLSGPLPTGRGSADVTLLTDQPLGEPPVPSPAGQKAWLDQNGLLGNFSLRFDQGAISNFDRPVFEELARGDAVFDIAKASDGAFEFTAATIEGRIDHGVAELTKATFEGPEKTLSLSGMVPYGRGGVTLAGSLAGRRTGDATITDPAIHFLVNGTWPEPVISPMAIVIGIPAN